MFRPLMLFSLLVAFAVGYAQESDIIFHVKYISSETVYLDGGADKHLQVGDRLLVRNKKKVVAELEVLYVADHSASCKVIKSKGKIQPGDMAVVYKRSKPVQKEEKKTPEEKPKEQPKAPTVEKKPKKRRKVRTGNEMITNVSGSISTQYYRWDDRLDSNLDYTQPTMRFNLRVRNLWGKHYHLRVRTRTRYHQRAREFNAQIPKQEWRNRVYELSFVYDNPGATLNYRLGRIISNYMSGVGYIDGMQLQYNFSQNMRVGIFGGTQPDWRTSGFQSNIQKFGMFWNYNRGERQKSYYQSTIAVAAEYHSSIVSREFIYVQNNLTFGNNLYLYQSAEVDVNRSWRKERSGQRFALSNLFISARYRLGNRFSMGITYDNRKNYWTYEIRSLEDILFDDALRQGLRGNVSLRLPGKIFIYSTVGMRKRETDSRSTFSYTGSIRKADFIFKRVSWHINYAGFDSPLTRGYTASMLISRTFRNGLRLEIGGGNYAYKGGLENTQRNNQWGRFSAYIPLPGRLFLNGQYEYSWGDDIQGQRFTGEIGYRF
ncbi:MAG: hypothetical protein D6748_11810 [Calditrichaeota bacterium]|nr:MAG: hypothetical protein D6748_11810 [Calditrichota bacterium]